MRYYKEYVTAIKSIQKRFICYAITIMLSILILTWVMELWRADIGIPFAYSGDALFGSMMIKGMIENGWYLHNSFVGAPFGLDMYDFPMADGFHFLLMKLISLFSSNYAAVLNLYYLLSFPLTAFTAVFVFRHFKISSSIAILFALLYSFLPYHFFRGQSHLFLAAYYMIPLITMLILWIWSDKPIFFSLDEETEKKFKLNLLHRKSLLSIIISLIVGSNGIYYAFFACFFIIIAGISSFFYRKNKYNLLSALILITLISGSVFLNILPSVIYTYQHGANPEVAYRSPVEAEVYGMKIINLLLPVNEHRVALISELKNKYNAINYPLQNENTVATLGFIGSLGFLALLSVFIFGFNCNNFFASMYSRLAVLNLSAVLLATIGGFGSLFALVVSPQIRTYNRISIFIAFFSLFAAALFIEELRQRYVKTNRQKYMFYFVIIIILFLGIFDQTIKNFAPPYTATKEDFLSDEEFIKTIEKTVPANSMIFQLPYVPFPENPPVYNMGDYELFRGYLHSDSLRWSYGAMKGRNGNWQGYIAKKPIDEFLTTISLVGFNGVYIDRNGYADSGAQIEAELTSALNTKPIVSKNNRLVFFNMVNFNASFKEKYTAAELEELKERALYTTLQSKLKNKSELILKTTDKDILLHAGLKKGIIGNGVSLESVFLSKNFTLEVILKPFGDQVPYASIMGNHPGYGGYEGFVIQQANQEQNIYYFSFANDEGWLPPNIRFELEKNKWNYLVITVENNEIKVYNNGTLITSANVKSSIRNSKMPLYIGNWINGDRPFNGLIEEVRISNGSISENEILSNWQEIQVKLDKQD